MTKTHRQVLCTTCLTFSIWVPKGKVKS
jgi:hypothetical protein